MLFPATCCESEQAKTGEQHRVGFGFGNGEDFHPVEGAAVTRKLQLVRHFARIAGGKLAQRGGYLRDILPPEENELQLINASRIESPRDGAVRL